MKLRELWKSLQGNHHDSCKLREEELKSGIDEIATEMEALRDRLEFLIESRDTQEKIIKQLQSENDTHTKALDEMRRKYTSINNERQRVASVNCHLQSQADDLQKKMELQSFDLLLYRSYFDEQLPAHASFIEWKSSRPKKSNDE